MHPVLTYALQKFSLYKFHSKIVVCENDNLDELELKFFASMKIFLLVQMRLLFAKKIMIIQIRNFI